MLIANSQTVSRRLAFPEQGTVASGKCDENTRKIIIMGMCNSSGHEVTGSENVMLDKKSSIINGMNQ